MGALAAVLAAALAVAAPAPARTVHVWDDQLASNLTPAQLAFVAGHVDGSQKLPRTQIDALHRLNPRFRVLQYRLAIGLGRRTQILDGDRWVPEWPAHPQERWFFHVGGRREWMKQWGWYLTNPDDPAWRRFFTAQLRGQVARTRADALFLDSASPPTYFGGSAWSPALRDLDVPFERAWSRRLERWLPYVQRAVGKPVVANAGSLVTTRDTTDYSHIAGIMIEGFGHGYAPGDWLLQQQRAWRLASKGRIVICQSYPANGADRLFDVASYLLVKGPRTYVNIQTTTAPEWWPEYDLDLGAPSGVAHYDNVAWRDYDRGRVLVNAGDTAQTVQLAGREALPSGGGEVGADGVPHGTISTHAVTSVTLPPHTAAVVYRY